MDATTTFLVYLVLGGIGLLVMCAAAGAADWFLGPDPDLEGPWDPEAPR